MEDGDGCRSRDEGHPNDEEDSNATSISDAMIDDEIADQPGLVMLGQVSLLFFAVFFLFTSSPTGCYVMVEYFLFVLCLSRCQCQHHRCARGDRTCSITPYRLRHSSTTHRRKRNPLTRTRDLLLLTNTGQ